MMATSSKQAVHTNLECPVCLRFFKDPKTLPCSHTFCKGCLETLSESHWNIDYLLCPTCSEGTFVPGRDMSRLQPNITVRSLVEASETKRSKWVLQTEILLPVEDTVKGMAISPNNAMAVWCNDGILIYSSEGSIQGTVLKSVQVHDLQFMPDTGYVIRDSCNRISLYTDNCEKLDVTFETMDVESDICGGLSVGKDGLIFVGYHVCKKIQVFTPEGGKAIREITCNGFEPWQIFAMPSSQAIVVKSIFEVHLINDVSGAIIQSNSKDGKVPYPAVYQDNSVIIAWVKRVHGLLSIVQYKQEPNKCIENIITDFKIITPHYDCYLEAFKTGEIVFCTHDKLYIFHESWE